jgi:hypothetical protein
LQLRVDAACVAVALADALAVGVARAAALAVGVALAVAGGAVAGGAVVVDGFGFGAALGDVLACGRADERATLPPAVLAALIMADAAASPPAAPMPTCAAALRLAGWATSESWAAWGLPLPARP